MVEKVHGVLGFGWVRGMTWFEVVRKRKKEKSMGIHELYEQYLWILPWEREEKGGGDRTKIAPGHSIPYNSTLFILWAHWAQIYRDSFLS